jgi:ADP-ribose pyrophosphatase YjhB (NUDIX family)
MGYNQGRFFHAVAFRETPRIRIAAIVVDDGKVLVQKSADNSASCYAFIGGGYEIGDAFEGRRRREFEEETNARVERARYLVCVESSFRHENDIVQQVEHFILVELDRHDVVSCEAHLKQRWLLTQHWLPIADLPNVDLQPVVVRDVVVSGRYLTDRHLIRRPD